MAPADFSDPAWTVRTGQAIWKPAADKPEIAGRILLGTRDSVNGPEDFIRFSKNPMGIVLARRNNQGWMLKVPAFNKSYSGRRKPPHRILWFQLAEAAFRNDSVPPWDWSETAPNHWTLVNPATGESLEGFFVQ